MKKIVYVLAAVIISAALGACERQDSQVTDSNSSVPAKTESTEVSSSESMEEHTIVGTISEIRDFAFVVETEDGKANMFVFDEIPQGLDSVKENDKVKVVYTGELSEVDPFEGKVISVEKVE